MIRASRLIFLSLFLGLAGGGPIGFLSCGPAYAAAPQRVTYQGTLRKDGIIYTGTVPMEFKITNAAGSVVYWTSGSTGVYVSAGLFRYPLGTPNEAQFAAIPWSTVSPFVRVTIDGSALPPDQLSATPYSLHAVTAEGSDGGFTVSNGDLKISTTTGSRGIIFQDGSVQYTAASGIGQITDGAILLTKLNQSGCAFGQIPKWNGAAWACGDDAGGSSYSADGTSLRLVGGVFSAVASSVTLQGNSFNAPNQLVRLTSLGYLPVLDGSLLVNVSTTQFRAVAIDTTAIAGLLSAEIANRALADSSIGLATATLRTDLNAISTTGFTAVGLATATLRADLNAVAASTGAINADLQNYKTTVQLSTAGIAAALANVVTSTGAIQASLNNVIASTGVIQTSLNNVIASTGAFQTSLNNVVISTGVIAADLAAEVAARALADSAIGLATATLRTDLNAISTAGFTAVGLATATLRTDLNAVAASTAPLANAANWNTAYGWGDHAEAGYAALSATQPFTGQNTFSNPGNVFYGDGSHLTGVSTGTVVEVYANNGTLGIGTAFYSFTTRVDITIHRLTATIYESGSAGSSIFRCGSAVDFVDVAVSGTDIIGQRVTVLTTKNIAKNTEVLCKIQESTQEDTPTVALSLQYSPS